jgi:hypothetical protein
VPGAASAQEAPAAPASGGEAGGAGVMVVGHGRAIGIGIERTLGGIAAATFVYDAGSWHIDALVGVLNVDRDPADDYMRVVVAGRFFYVVHRAERADLSLGGGVGFISEADETAGDEDETNIHIEAAAQIRAFLVPNVAISASLGVLVIEADDRVIGGADEGNDGVGVISLSGDVVGAFGLTYFF